MLGLCERASQWLSVKKGSKKEEGRKEGRGRRREDSPDSVYSRTPLSPAIAREGCLNKEGGAYTRDPVRSSSSATDVNPPGARVRPSTCTLSRVKCQAHDVNQGKEGPASTARPCRIRPGFTICFCGDLVYCRLLVHALCSLYGSVSPNRCAGCGLHALGHFQADRRKNPVAVEGLAADVPAGKLMKFTAAPHCL